MQLSIRQVEVINQLYMMNLNLARGDDSQRRELTKKIAEQFNFEGGMSWGMKARPGGDISTASKDSIGYLEQDNTVSVWDWQNGTSRAPQVTAGQQPNYPHLPRTEAIFVSVQPINHLAAPDNGHTGDDELDGILKAVIATQNEIAVIHGEIFRAQEMLARMLQQLQVIIDKPIEFPPFTPPTYESNKLPIFGTITLKPKQ